jgi:hypothetical protein
MNNAAQIDRIRGHVSELEEKAHHLRAKRIAATYLREVSSIADVRKDYAAARAAVLAETVRTGGSLGGAIIRTMPPRGVRRRQASRRCPSCGLASSDAKCPQCGAATVIATDEGQSVNQSQRPAKLSTSKPTHFIPVSGAAPGDHAGFALRQLHTAKTNAAEFTRGLR